MVSGYHQSLRHPKSQRHLLQLWEYLGDPLVLESFGEQYRTEGGPRYAYPSQHLPLACQLPVPMHESKQQ